MSTRFYNTGRTEPDMRKELSATFDGIFPEIAKAQKVVLRKMDITKPCECVDILTKEPDKDVFCPICLGEGFHWEETFLDTYKVIIRSSVGLSSKEELISPGLVNIALVSFYFRYGLTLNTTQGRSIPDRIVELVLGVDGKPVRPYRREHVYRIGTAIDFRSDHGRLEYWKLDCYEEQVKFLNGPEG